jgi:hypothetical protein
MISEQDLEVSQTDATGGSVCELVASMRPSLDNDVGFVESFSF